MSGPLVLVTTVPWTLKTLFVEQVRRLAAEGYDVHAISSPGPDLEDFARATGARVHAVPMYRGLSPLADLVSLWRLFRLAVNLGPAIVHAHTPKAGLVGMLAAWLAGVPFRVYTVHGLPLETRAGWMRLLLMQTERLSCFLAHEVLAVSPSLVTELASLRITRRARLLADGSMFGIPPGRFDPDRWAVKRVPVRRQYGIPPDALVLGFAGRIVGDKGIAELAAAWRTLREEYPSSHLLLCGAEEEGDPAPTAAMQALRACPRVHWTSEMVEDMPGIYAALDLLVLPTYREGLPTVVLEAAAMRVPAVVTRVTGAVDSVVDGQTGLVVPARDPEALAGAIRRLASDADLRESMGKAARTWVAEHFDWDRVAAALLTLYREQQHARNRFIYVSAKRAFDLLATCLGLLAAAPILACAAILVRAVLGSPVLFRQKRLGRDGRPFVLYKLRTMTEQRSADGRLLNDAARLTPFGRWLRATSLDELPQLWNVLRGEMSLVGPRPLLPQYWERYSEQQRRRHENSPGITGWAQIHGRNALDWESRFALDVWYVDHAGFLLDLQILLRTVGAVFTRRGIQAQGHFTMPEFRGSEGKTLSSS